MFGNIFRGFWNSFSPTIDDEIKSIGADLSMGCIDGEEARDELDYYIKEVIAKPPDVCEGVGSVVYQCNCGIHDVAGRWFNVRSPEYNKCERYKYSKIIKL